LARLVVAPDISPFFEILDNVLNGEFNNNFKKNKVSPTQEGEEKGGGEW
jgi:hypothetical protein